MITPPVEGQIKAVRVLPVDVLGSLFPELLGLLNKRIGGPGRDDFGSLEEYANEMGDVSFGDAEDTLVTFDKFFWILIPTFAEVGTPDDSQKYEDLLPEQKFVVWRQYFTDSRGLYIGLNG
jgi:hypothetical protein